MLNQDALIIRTEGEMTLSQRGYKNELESSELNVAKEMAFLDAALTSYSLHKRIQTIFRNIKYIIAGSVYYIKGF